MSSLAHTNTHTYRRSINLPFKYKYFPVDITKMLCIPLINIGYYLYIKLKE